MELRGPGVSHDRCHSEGAGRICVDDSTILKVFGEI